ncbi:hypothetical protein SPRG_15577 [Saprolegnia parasitica CBS 223.65]|uniref:Ndc10 domain-containing protein n=1 Tax=Saprolegnia parasitica (strain CBS 223.65) TaxID=695850 RepID=A0A067BLL4_SAPPC|nr:hypothetical protein SPRG_15577 [Saprolegnia parasitica CBS 223.65]KDO19098.1 hypothetical protein SPRG_15577 [Saprolegnia parasitica CBS 223.65]|eukprot:XP_012210201.1 hypothetical protein SPRG_15577 [Saprolegnia parasitica CBS 223.65]
MAEMGGASEAQIRRLGHWNNQAMEGCYLTKLPRYLTKLPREAMRVMAGFSPDPRLYYLERGQVEPDQELQALVFPDAANWLAKLNDGKCEATIAARGFLELLMHLRVVLLQDSVLLKKLYPAHPMWSAPLFSHPLYTAFEIKMEHLLIDTNHKALTTSMNLVTSGLEDVRAVVNNLRTDVAAQGQVKWNPTAHLGSLPHELPKSPQPSPPPSPPRPQVP